METALTNEKPFAEREQYLQRVVDENERALELARVQCDVGQIDLLSVLQVQAKWIGARVGLLRIKNDRLAQPSISISRSTEASRVRVGEKLCVVI